MCGTVELKQWGNSLAVRLPKAVLSKAGIDSLPEEFDVKVNNKKEIILSKKKKPESLSELFKGFDYKKYWSDWKKENPGKSKEIDWGEPTGRELF